jgi:hypothetical protein
MTKTLIRASGAPEPVGPYSQAVSAGGFHLRQRPAGGGSLHGNHAPDRGEEPG